MSGKKVYLVVIYIVFIAVLFSVADFVYGFFFEKLPPLRDTVYLQMFKPGIHKKSDINELLYELKPNSFSKNNTINCFGMKDKEVKLKKDTFRVLVLGDSVTFGPKIPNDYVFTEIAEKILAEQGKKIEVLNAGVSGYNTKQEFILFKEKFVDLRPDLVIFAFCINDMGEAVVQYLPNDYLLKSITKKSTKLGFQNLNNVSVVESLALTLPNNLGLNHDVNSWLMLHSSIYRFIAIRSFCKNKNIAFRDIRFSLTSFDFDGVLKEIHNFCLSHDFILRFVVLPVPLREKAVFNSEFNRKCFEDNNISYWDFNSIINKKSQNTEDIWLNDGSLHLNRKGHILAGKLLAEHIDQLVIKLDL